MENSVVSKSTDKVYKKHRAYFVNSLGIHISVTEKGRVLEPGKPELVHTNYIFRSRDPQNICLNTKFYGLVTGSTLCKENLHVDHIFVSPGQEIIVEVVNKSDQNILLENIFLCHVHVIQRDNIIEECEIRSYESTFFPNYDKVSCVTVNGGQLRDGEVIFTTSVGTANLDDADAVKVYVQSVSLNVGSIYVIEHDETVGMTVALRVRAESEIVERTSMTIVGYAHRALLDTSGRFLLESKTGDPSYDPYDVYMNTDKNHTVGLCVSPTIDISKPYPSDKNNLHVEFLGVIHPVNELTMQNPLICRQISEMNIPYGGSALWVNNKMPHRWIDRETGENGIFVKARSQKLYDTGYVFSRHERLERKHHVLLIIADARSRPGIMVKPQLYIPGEKIVVTLINTTDIDARLPNKAYLASYYLVEPKFGLNLIFNQKYDLNSNLMIELCDNGKVNESYPQDLGAVRRNLMYADPSDYDTRVFSSYVVCNEIDNPHQIVQCVVRDLDIRANYRIYPIDDEDIPSHFKNVKEERRNDEAPIVAYGYPLDTTNGDNIFEMYVGRLSQTDLEIEKDLNMAEPKILISKREDGLFFKPMENGLIIKPGQQMMVTTGCEFGKKKAGYPGSNYGRIIGICFGTEFASQKGIRVALTKIEVSEEIKVLVKNHSKVSVDLTDVYFMKLIVAVGSQYEQLVLQYTTEEQMSVTPILLDDFSTKEDEYFTVPVKDIEVRLQPIFSAVHKIIVPYHTTGFMAFSEDMSGTNITATLIKGEEYTDGPPDADDMIDGKLIVGYLKKFPRTIQNNAAEDVCVKIYKSFIGKSIVAKAHWMGTSYNLTCIDLEPIYFGVDKQKNIPPQDPDELKILYAINDDDTQSDDSDLFDTSDSDSESLEDTLSAETVPEGMYSDDEIDEKIDQMSFDLRNDCEIPTPKEFEADFIDFSSNYQMKPAATPYAAGIDIKCGGNYTIEACSSSWIYTNVHVKVPTNTAILVFGRSSNYRKRLLVEPKLFWSNPSPEVFTQIAFKVKNMNGGIGDAIHDVKLTSDESIAQIVVIPLGNDTVNYFFKDSVEKAILKAGKPATSHYLQRDEKFSIEGNEIKKVDTLHGIPGKEINTVSFIVGNKLASQMGLVVYPGVIDCDYLGSIQAVFDNRMNTAMKDVDMYSLLAFATFPIMPVTLWECIDDTHFMMHEARGVYPNTFLEWQYSITTDAMSVFKDTVFKAFDTELQDTQVDPPNPGYSFRSHKAIQNDVNDCDAGLAYAFYDRMLSFETSRKLAFQTYRNKAPSKIKLPYSPYLRDSGVVRGEGGFGSSDLKGKRVTFHIETAIACG